MEQRSQRTAARQWYDSAHASLCLLGSYLQQTGFFRPLEEGLKIQQKVRKYTPVQKVKMVFVAVLAGAKAVAHTATTVRVDRALQVAFGLPGCAEPSVLADTLDAATEQNVVELRQAIEAALVRFSQARRHDYAQAVLVLDLDRSPLPASRHAEGSERGYLGRSRSKTGRKLVRVRAAQYQETVWDDVVPGRTAESLPGLPAAVLAAERLLGLDDANSAGAAKRARTEWRLASGWGSEALLNWLLGRGDQVTGKFTSYQRVQKLLRSVGAWQPTASPGREVAVSTQPAELALPVPQYAVRTPSQERASGY